MTIGDKRVVRPQLPPLALIASSKLRYESVTDLENNDDARVKMEQTLEAHKL
jgi:hypothetical protein